MQMSRQVCIAFCIVSKHGRGENLRTVVRGYSSARTSCSAASRPCLSREAFLPVLVSPSTLSRTCPGNRDATISDDLAALTTSCPEKRMECSSEYRQELQIPPNLPTLLAACVEITYLSISRPNKPVVEHEKNQNNPKSCTIDVG